MSTTPTTPSATPTANASCCHAQPAAQITMPSHAHLHGMPWKAAAQVTLHCLTGCLIGEWLGLAIGIALALSTAHTVITATLLAYFSGFTLTLWPLLRRGLTFKTALATVFIGEAVSIGVMEIAMNFVDYSMGGMGVKSLISARYWQALLAASVAGYLAAVPVNAWLLSRNLKNCH